VEPGKEATSVGKAIMADQFVHSILMMWSSLSVLLTVGISRIWHRETPRIRIRVYSMVKQFVLLCGKRKN